MPTTDLMGAQGPAARRASIRDRGHRCENCLGPADVYAQDEDLEGYYFCDGCYDGLNEDAEAEDDNL